MRELLWKAVAAVVSQPRVASWLIERSKRTPYTPITSRDGSEVYMGRWWVFNPYPAPGEYRRKGWRDLMPSIRVHHILRADDDEHMHDHPWNARTIVLRGWYREEHPRVSQDSADGEAICIAGLQYPEPRTVFARPRSYTGRVLFGEYHRISEVSPGGVFTLWFTWKYQGTWGFLVDGKKVPYKTYLADRPRA